MNYVCLSVTLLSFFLLLSCKKKDDYDLPTANRCEEVIQAADLAGKYTGRYFYIHVYNFQNSEDTITDKSVVLQVEVEPDDPDCFRVSSPSNSNPLVNYCMNKIDTRDSLFLYDFYFSQSSIGFWARVFSYSCEERSMRIEFGEGHWNAVRSSKKIYYVKK